MNDLWIILWAWVCILASVAMLKLYFIEVSKEANEYYKKIVSTMRGVLVSEIEFNERGQAVGGYEFYLNQYKSGRPYVSGCSHE